MDMFVKKHPFWRSQGMCSLIPVYLPANLNQILFSLPKNHSTGILLEAIRRSLSSTIPFEADEEDEELDEEDEELDEDEEELDEDEEELDKDEEELDEGE